MSAEAKSKKDNGNLAQPSGTSRAAALRRLRKDRPDLHGRVLAGELSAHAVAWLEVDPGALTAADLESLDLYQLESELRLMLPVTTLSAFLNNTPVVAIFIPAVSTWAKKIKIPQSICRNEADIVSDRRFTQCFNFF